MEGFALPVTMFSTALGVRAEFCLLTDFFYQRKEYRLDDHIFLNNLSERLSRLEKDMEEMRQVMSVQEISQKHTGTYLEQKSSARAPGESSGDWEVTCFGRFHHRCSGREVPPCHSRRGQSILKYLLDAQEHAASAERLVDCFWPHMDSVAGTHNLQMAVYALRHTLRDCGPNNSNEIVLFCESRYLLNPALTITRDVDAFCAAYQRGQEASERGDMPAALEAFEQARSLYQGDYFADPYEEWASAPRRMFQDMWLALLNQSGIFYERLGEWPKAVSCYHNILDVDGTREDITRQLMRCYAAEGRAADIKQAYRSCQECLRRDLYLVPAPETRTLYYKLLAHLNSPADH